MQRTLKEAQAALWFYWGHTEFRPGQAAAIEAAMAGRDVLAILPTGGGKSICYQAPAVVNDGITLVVSPLVALMHDQVNALLARGVRATYIDSTLRPRNIDQRWTDVEFGRYRLVYVSPERLRSEVFLARAERLGITLLAIDEAHCVSTWGHQFRPAYLDIPEVYPLLKHPPVIATTATATPEVRRDIVEHLHLRAPDVIVKGFDRPNITWSLFKTDKKRPQVRSVLKGVPGSGVLYAATRRSVEAWVKWLRAEGHNAVAYHAGLPAAKRSSAQKAWLEDRARIVVATSAFGMGIDKPEVRFVIHVNLPASLEAYYQEAGRAGRDGQRAYAVLIFSPEDENIQRSLIDESHPGGQAIRLVYDAVCNLSQIPIASLPDEPITPDMEALAARTGFRPVRIRRALDLLAEQETWRIAPARKHKGLLRFRLSADELRQYAHGLNNSALAQFVLALLRTVHAEAFSAWKEINLIRLADRVGLSRARLASGMDFLSQQGLLSWREAGVTLRFNHPRSERLVVDDLAIQRSRRRAERRLDDMLRYTHAARCRRRFLLGYFGEEHAGKCGRCDVCLGRHPAEDIHAHDEPLLREVLEWARSGRPRREWFAEEADTEKAQSLTDFLVREGYLKAREGDAFSLTEKAAALLDQWKPRDDARPQ